MKKYLSLVVLISLIATATGCLRSKKAATSAKTVDLVYYKLFDNDDVIQPLIQEFQSQYSYIRIKYKKFTDINEYEDLIVNELAEGQGPDIFEIHNSWLPKHRKKITPMIDKFMTPEIFRQTFVDVAATDLVAKDDQDKEQIYGLPLTVDTLGLYYNKAIFEDKIPSRGRPGSTWEEIKDDVYKINKPDNSAERFEVSGIAMGRSDNILRSVDILYLLFLQNQTQFYDNDSFQPIFADQQGISSLGQRLFPGLEALSLYTSFALPSNKEYSWNAYLADPNSSEKEIDTFVRGKTAMIISYSYGYNQIQNLLKTYDNKSIAHIKAGDVQVAPIPQLTIGDKDAPRATYASYFAETVSRTSAHPREAWKFLQFLSSKTSQIHYHKETSRPTSRRDLIEDQKKEPIYGVFAGQIGYAKSLVIFDYDKYKKIFDEAVTKILNTETTKEALQYAQNEIRKLIPEKINITKPAPKPAKSATTPETN